DFNSVRKALEKSQEPDDRVLAQAERLLAWADRHPERAGEAHFLLGSVCLRLAEQSPADRASQARAQAALHLETAENLGVPPADQPRLLYRLGKVWLQSDRDLPRAIAYLERALLQGPDDAAEGFSLLAQAYLRLPAPNLEGALQAN